MKKSTGKKPATPIKNVVIDEKEGTLTAFGERFLFIPVKLIHSIEDRLTRSLGPVTATSFEYEIGREGGGNFIQLAKRAGLGIKTPSEIQQIADILGTTSGWGKVDVVDFNFPNRLVRVKWRNGVSVRNRTGKTPVCHFGRGVLTGAVAEILGSRCESIELSCQGKGDEYCEAVIGDPREIDRIVNMER